MSKEKELWLAIIITVITDIILIIMFGCKLPTICYLIIGMFGGVVGIITVKFIKYVKE